MRSSHHASPFPALLLEEHAVASLEDHKQLKAKIKHLLPVAKQVLERLHQNEDLYLGARAIELLAENMAL